MAAAPDSDWLDDMVKKLIDELKRQLEVVTQAKTETSTAQTRAADARTLATLERTLEKLSRLERERAQVREKKIAKHDPEHRAALERRLDQRLAGGGTKDTAGKSE